MPKFRITWAETEYWSSTIEAKDEKEALEKAHQSEDFFDNAISHESEYIDGTTEITREDE